MKINIKQYLSRAKKFFDKIKKKKQGANENLSPAIETESSLLSVPSDEDKTDPNITIPIASQATENSDDLPNVELPQDEPTVTQQLATEDVTGDVPTPSERSSDIITTDNEDVTGEIHISAELSRKEKFFQFLELKRLKLKDLIARFKMREFSIKNLKFNKDETSKRLEQFKNLVSKIDTTKLNKYADKYLSKRNKDWTISQLSKLKKVDWKNLHNTILSVPQRTPIQRGFVSFLFIFFIYLVGKTTGLFLKGQKEPKHITGKAIHIELDGSLTTTDINTIRSAQLFKTQQAEGDKDGQTARPVIATNIPCTQGTQKSSLPIKLVNTVVLQDSVKSIAAVQVRSKSVLTEVREGDKIENLAKVDKIDRLGIVVKNLQSGTCEDIVNDNDWAKKQNSIAVLDPNASKQFKKTKLANIKGIKNEGNKFEIDKAFLKDKMKNLNDILTQARGIPIQNPDGTLSFKIVEIEPGGLFAYLGVQNDDVIGQINGQKINNLNEVMNLFSKISNLENLNLTIMRNNQEMELEYKMK